MPCRLRIFGNRTRAGCYRAYVWKSPTTTAINFDTNALLSEALWGVQGDEVIAINQAEVGETTIGHVLPIGTLVWGFPSPLTSTDTPVKPVYEVTTPWIGGLIRVVLSSPSGSNGTKTTAASYTYTVKDLEGISFGAGYAPEKSRPNGAVTAATQGIGYFNTSGTFVLYEAYELPGTGVCA